MQREINYTRKSLTYGNYYKVKRLRKDNPKKSLVNANPLYKEIPHTGGNNIQGEPLVNIRGNHLQREINYTRKSLIKGKSLIQGNPLHVETLVK